MEELPKEKRLLFWQRKGSKRMTCLVLNQRKYQNPAEWEVGKVLERERNGFSFPSARLVEMYCQEGKERLSWRFRERGKIIDMVTRDITYEPVNIWEN